MLLIFFILANQVCNFVCHLVNGRFLGINGKHASTSPKTTNYFPAPYVISLSLSSSKKVSNFL